MTGLSVIAFNQQLLSTNKRGLPSEFADIGRGIGRRPNDATREYGKWFQPKSDPTQSLEEAPQSWSRSIRLGLLGCGGACLKSMQQASAVGENVKFPRVRGS
jgi:hypothetical protein